MISVAERVAVGVASRHQVEELPVMAVRVTEHQCQRVRCAGCGARLAGELPADVAGSAFGPRLQAAVVTLSVRNRVSRRDVVELCEQLFAAAEAAFGAPSGRSRIPTANNASPASYPAEIRDRPDV